MLQTNHNPTTAEVQMEKTYLLRCLARDVLGRYPNKLKRQQFYANYHKHHGQTGLDQLREAVHAEYDRFLGWCSLHSRVSSHTVLLHYLDESAPTIALYRQIPLSPIQQADLAPEADARVFSSESSPTVAPWWTDVPWLAPRTFIPPAMESVWGSYDS